jgi:hypothetical protein
VNVCVLGEFGELTLIYEEKLIGGILNWDFLGVYPGLHVDTLRRGGPCCVLGEFIVLIGDFNCVPSTYVGV